VAFRLGTTKKKRMSRPKKGTLSLPKKKDSIRWRRERGVVTVRENKRRGKEKKLTILARGRLASAEEEKYWGFTGGKEGRTRAVALGWT